MDSVSRMRTDPNDCGHILGMGSADLLIPTETVHLLIMVPADDPKEVTSRRTQGGRHKDGDGMQSPREVLAEANGKR